MSATLSKVIKDENETINLLKAYKKNLDPKTKNQIVKLNLPLVQKIAKNYSQFNKDFYEDLVQVGSLGLINSIDRFDPIHNASFKTYSTHLISGEIKHYLRDHSSIIKPPRELQELQPKINRAIQEIVIRKNQEPTKEEISNFIDIPLDKVNQVFEMEYSLNLVSFDQKMQPNLNDSKTIGEQIEDKKYSTFQAAQEDKIFIDQAVENIEQQSREIIEYAFYQDLSQTEIAKKMGISQMQVSRKLKSALKEVWDILNSRVTPW